MYYVSNRVANLLFPNLSEDCMQCTGVRPTKSDNVQCQFNARRIIYNMSNDQRDEFRFDHRGRGDRQHPNLHVIISKFWMGTWIQDFVLVS